MVGELFGQNLQNNLAGQLDQIYLSILEAGDTSCNNLDYQYRRLAWEQMIEQPNCDLQMIKPNDSSEWEEAFRAAFR